MELSVFNNENSNVRTAEIDGKIWFVGSDVAKSLGYVKPNNALKKHCKEKGTLKRGTLTQGGEQQMVMINEGNVHRLIAKSKLPAAEAFEEWLFDEVVPQIRKTGSYGKPEQIRPAFYYRYMANMQSIDRGKYFSVITELFAGLHCEFEANGYILKSEGPDGKGIYPDISVGRCFADYLRKLNSPYSVQYEMYEHIFPDGRAPVKARMYPVGALGLFRDYTLNVWMPERAHKYFADRDPEALNYLPKLIA